MIGSRRGAHDPASVRARSSRRISAAGLIIALVAVTAVPSAVAQDENQALHEGPWSGLMSIRGSAIGSFEGVPVEYTIGVEGFFDLEIGINYVEEDANTIGGTEFLPIEGGSWSFDGNAQFEADMPGSGGTGLILWDLAGSGGFEGTAAAPVHVGTVNSTGVLTAEVAGLTRTVDLGSDASDARLRVQLESVSCYEVYGDVSVTLSELIQEQGLSTAFEGPWAAYRDTQAIKGAISSWRAEMRGIGTIVGEPVTLPEGTPEIVLLFGELLGEYNAWVDEFSTAVDRGAVDEALWNRAADLINDQATFLARLRNLSECDREVIDPDLLEQFDTVIKRSMLWEIELFLDGHGLTASQLTILTAVAMNAGVLGAAGPQPQASSVEELLRLATEEIITTDVIRGSEDGTEISESNLADPDVQKALALAASMNWSFAVDGTTYQAADVWESYERQRASEASAGDEGGG